MIMALAAFTLGFGLNFWISEVLLNHGGGKVPLWAHAWVTTLSLIVGVLWATAAVH